MLQLILVFALALLPARGAGRSTAGRLPPAAGDTTARDSIGTVAGTVKDSAGTPIRLATVILDTGEVTTFSRGDGSFGPVLLAAGPHRVTVAADGFAPVGATFQLASHASIRLEITLISSGVRLPTVRVRASRELFAEPRLSGFLHRLAAGTGQYMDARQIRARGYPPLTELLRTVPGVQLVRVPSQFGNAYALLMHGQSTFGACPTQVYVDGHPAALSSTDPLALDHLIQTREIAAIEIYPGASSVPPQFNGPSASCGVLVLWTRDAATTP